MKRRFPVLMGAVFLCIVTFSALGQDAFQRVEVQALKRNPQHFWARGIVFEDVLVEHPRGSTIRIENRTYERFRTQTLGEVYATGEAVGKLRQLPLQKSYLFSGTVLQQDAGVTRRFLRGSASFLYVVQDVAVPVEAFSEAVQDLEAMQEAMKLAEEAEVPAELQPVLNVIRAVEQGLFTFAQDNGVSVEQLFDPDSEFAGTPERLALQEIRRMERSQGFSVQMFLADYSISLLRRRYRPDDPIRYVDAAPSMIPDENEFAGPEATAPEPEDDWDAWFAPVDEEPTPFHDPVEEAVEEEVFADFTEPAPPATLQIEGDRTVEIMPEPIPIEVERIELLETEELALPDTENEIESLLLQTRWDLPDVTPEVPVITQPDLEDFPGLHDELVTRPWEEMEQEEIEELLLADPPEDLFEAPYVADPPQPTPDSPERDEPDLFTPDQLASLDLAPAPDIPELLPFPVPGTDPLPEPEPLVTQVEEERPLTVPVGPFRLPVIPADFFLDR